MRFVKPLDTDLICELAAQHDLLVTVEENAIAGGAGSAVSEYLSSIGATIPVLQLGLPDTFLDHGKHADLLAGCGLDAEGIEEAINSQMALLSPRQNTAK